MRKNADRDAGILEMVRSGMKVRETAEAVGLSVAAVKSVVRRAGVSIVECRRDALNAQVAFLVQTGLTLKETARRLRVSRDRVLLSARELGIGDTVARNFSRFMIEAKRLPAADERKIVDLRRDGNSQLRIAMLTGIPRSTVANVLRRNGMGGRLQDDSDQSREAS